MNKKMQIFYNPFIVFKQSIKKIAKNKALQIDFFKFFPWSIRELNFFLKIYTFFKN